MLQFHRPQFVKSAIWPGEYPQHSLPEIALAGRSNVGKSSLLNRVLNRKKLARTSSQPGRTQTLNFYNLDDRLYVVDLPGYGFARVPRKVKERWGKMMDEYFQTRENLKGLIHIIDARHKPTENDRQMHRWLEYSGLPYLTVATKADKLSRNQLNNQRDIIIKNLNLRRDDLVFFSAETGQGKEKVLQFFSEIINDS